MEEKIQEELTPIQKASVNMDSLKKASRIPTYKKDYIREIKSIARDKDEAYDLLRYYRLLNGIRIIKRIK